MAGSLPGLTGKAIAAWRCVGLALVATLLLSSPTAHADRGVGVNLGRIEVSDALSQGGRYNLPVVGVINTGDEAGDYEVNVSYLQDQKESKPAASWFDFQPKRFPLEAGQQQNVQIRLTLPSSTTPGEYFALIQVQPLVKGEGVVIGAAAATTLSFTVTPSSWLEAQRLRINRWLDDTQPWSTLLPSAGVIAVLIIMLRRRFKVRLRIERR